MYTEMILDDLQNTEELLSIFPSANDYFIALDIRYVVLTLLVLLF